MTEINNQDLVCQSPWKQQSQVKPADWGGKEYIDNTSTPPSHLWYLVTHIDPLRLLAASSLTNPLPHDHL